MRVLFRTFGCKANQYDTERMRQELEALGAQSVLGPGDADLCVVNTCTVTNQADADARRFIRRLRREDPGTGVVVVGCSAALKPQTYREMEGVVGALALQRQPIPTYEYPAMMRKRDFVPDVWIHPVRSIGKQILALGVENVVQWLVRLENSLRRRRIVSIHIPRDLTPAKKQVEVLAFLVHPGKDISLHDAAAADNRNRQ